MGMESTSPWGATLTVPLLPGAAVAAVGIPATMREVRTAADAAAEVRTVRIRMFISVSLWKRLVRRWSGAREDRGAVHAVLNGTPLKWLRLIIDKLTPEEENPLEAALPGPHRACR